MNRNATRRVHKLTGQEIEERESKLLSGAVNLTLKTVYKVMSEEFGFGEKRLDKLERGILEKLKEEE